MGDIISRIKLETVGADQASREVRKLKKAFQETQQASEGIGGGVGGGGDPATQATMPSPGAGGAGGGLPAHRGEHQQYLRDQRGRQSQSPLVGYANTAGSMVQDISSGRPQGAMATGMSAMGALGPAGAMMAIGAVAIKTLGSLAEKEEGRMQQLWASGISQRFGSYDQTRGVSLEMLRQGVPKAMIPDFLNTLSNAGGRVGERDNLNVYRGVEVATSLGLNGGLIANTLGGAQRLGMGDAMSDDYYRYAKGTFGKFGNSAMNTYISASGQYLNTQGSAGVRASSLTEANFDASNRDMMGYVDYAGMTPEGAVGASQSSNARATSSSSLSRPEDVMILRAIMSANPSFSLTDARVWMEENPQGVKQLMYQSILGRSKDWDMRVIMAQKWLGGTTSEAVGFMETQAGLTYGDDLTKSGESDIFGLGGFPRESERASNYAILENFELQVQELKTRFLNKFYGPSEMDARSGNVRAGLADFRRMTHQPAPNNDRLGMAGGNFYYGEEGRKYINTVTGAPEVGDWSPAEIVEEAKNYQVLQNIGLFDRKKAKADLDVMFPADPNTTTGESLILLRQIVEFIATWSNDVDTGSSSSGDKDMYGY